MMDVEEICSGWLTKSPSSKYVTLFSHGKLSIRVPLKSKWRRRYFVLHKPHGSLPHQYAFDYFKDEHDHRRRGTINLEECESILSELDSSHYPYLFSIKTKARNKDRVYYLAAETEDDMTRWVKCLCSLCDLKMGPTSPTSPPPPAVDAISTENHTVAPNPPVRHDSMQLTVDLPSHRASSNQNLADEELSNQILEEIEAIEQGRLDVDTRPMNGQVPVGYTELADCTTGDSVGTEANGGFIELYDVPKSHCLVAPSRLGQSQSVRRPNKPLIDGIQASRSANSSPRCARTLPNTRSFGDALAPPRPPKSGQPMEDMYQNISGNSPLLLRDGQSSPLLRPNNNHLTAGVDGHSAASSLHNSPASYRKTEFDDGRRFPSQDGENFYLNTATLSADGASDVVSAHAHQNPGNVYDVPRSVNISAAIPAPAQCAGTPLQTAHRYVNAPACIMTKDADGVVTSTREVTDAGDSTSPSADPISLTRQHVNDNHYDVASDLPVPGTPTRPPKPRNLSDTATLDGTDDEGLQTEHRILKVSKSFRTREYTKDNVFSDSEESPLMRAREEIKLPSRINTNDSTSTSSYDREDEDVNSEDEVPYATPPAPRPLQPQLPERLHHIRPFHSTVEGFTSAGTSSLSNVKRSSSMSKVPAPYGSTNVSELSSNTGSPSPKLKNNTHNSLRSERSSTVCSSDWRNKPLNVNSMGIMQPMPRTSHRNPLEPVRDIQYVELDQSNDRRAPSPLPPRASFSNMIPVGGQALASVSTDTLEYTDIDLLKTQALTVTRRERDLMKRGEDLD